MNDLIINEMLKYDNEKIIETIFNIITSKDDINPINKNIKLKIEYGIIDQHSLVKLYSFGCYNRATNMITINAYNCFKSLIESSRYSTVLNNYSNLDILVSLIYSTIIHETLHANQSINLINKSAYIEQYIENPVRSLTYYYSKKYKSEIDEIFNCNIILDYCVHHSYFIDNQEEIDKYVSIQYSEFIINRILLTFFNCDDNKVMLSVYTTLSNIFNSNKDIILELRNDDNIIKILTLRSNNIYNIEEVNNVCTLLYNNVHAYSVNICMKPNTYAIIIPISLDNRYEKPIKINPIEFIK